MSNNNNTQTPKDVTDWRISGKHLPDFLKDFHDQKEIFNLVHETLTYHEALEEVGPVTAHKYTIDCFLWVMARYGYTLQKNRSNVDFHDMNAALSTMRANKIKKLEDLFKKGG